MMPPLTRSFSSKSGSRTMSWQHQLLYLLKVKIWDYDNEIHLNIHEPYSLGLQINHMITGEMGTNNPPPPPPVNKFKFPKLTWPLIPKSIGLFLGSHATLKHNHCTCSSKDNRVIAILYGNFEKFKVRIWPWPLTYWSQNY